MIVQSLTVNEQLRGDTNSFSLFLNLLPLKGYEFHEKEVLAVDFSYFISFADII